MNKYKETFEVDINKDVFDVPGSINGHTQYKMMCKVLRNFLKSYPKTY
jgi:transposase